MDFASNYLFGFYFEFFETIMHADFRLYIEEIDVGEPEPRQIISGLRDHYTLDEMKDKVIVTICNLKPSKMRGICTISVRLN